MTFTVRPATAGDRPILDEMILAAANWRLDDGRPVKGLDHPGVAHYVDGWPRSTDIGVVAEGEQGRPIGAAWLRFFTDDDPGDGFVRPDIPELAIGVVQPWRGRGVGRALLRSLADAVRASGITAISLSVERVNPAAALYASEGYRVVGGNEHSDTMLLNLR